MLSRGSLLKGRVLAAQQARSYVSAAPEPQVGIVGSIFGKSGMPRVPLSVPFKADNVPKSGSVAPEAIEGPKVTTLANGLRVATAGSERAVAHVGLFVKSGSRYETPETRGMSTLLEDLAFKSSNERSAFRFVRDTSKLGANISAAPGREIFQLSASGLNTFVPNLMQILNDQVFDAAYYQDEVTEATEKYNFNHQQQALNSEHVVHEGLHNLAFGQSGLGRSLYAPAESVAAITADGLRAYVNQHYTADRMVLSASGVNHEEFVEAANQVFGHLKTGVAQSASPSAYHGGQGSKNGESADGLAHVALAHEAPSWQDPDFIPTMVLQSMMGGGSAFSAGGPGKGMYSRLYTNVLRQQPWIYQCSAFASIYSDTGLFGISGAAAPEDAQQLYAVINQEYERMTGPVNDVELSRAINQLQGACAREMENSYQTMHEFGVSLLMIDNAPPVSETLAKIGQVKAEDVQRVAKRMRATEPSIFTFGAK